MPEASDIYSFLNTDVAEAFECFFLFDTLTNTINVYKEDNVGKDTNIHVSYVNLLKNTNLSCSTDNIKTCLTITGSDDLTVREINMGYDKIYNFNYYNSTEFMSRKLYDAYNKWVALRNEKLPTYTSLLSQYQDYYKQINFLSHEKMPSVTGSTNWSEYGLEPLKEQLASYEQKQSVSMKSGHGDPSSQFYNSEYLPIYNTIQAITAQIKEIENQIKALQNQQSSISDQMSAIITAIDMQNNFTADELKELTTFIREDELNSSNYVVTDIMTDDERFEMLNDLLKFGENELAKVSVPQLSFSADMVNLFAIPEFEEFYDDFDPGNYIWVTLRDDFSVKAKLLSVHLNFHDPTDFSVTFGNVVRRAKTRYSDFADTIRTAVDTATAVSFNSSHWSQAAKDTSTIGRILDEGLIAAGKYLKNGDDSEMVIDTRGIFINTISGDHAYKDSIFLGGGRILFTDDNWKTVSMSVGRADVTIKGVTESRFGTFADFVIAGYVGGSTLEGSEIIGGVLVSTNYDPGKAGSSINLNDGTFEFNANGAQKLTLDANGVLTVKGTIKADLGYIGGKDGFTIMSEKLYSKKDSLSSNTDGVYIGTDGIALGANSKFKALSDGTLYAEKGYFGGTNGFVLETKKIYNGKSTFSDTSNGVYIGTDGIALGADNVFSVTPQGYIIAKYGSIGGAVITNNSIHASNDNWWISSDGSASFKNVTITGTSTFGSTVANPFSGTTIPHIQELAANYIKVNYLDAINANISNLFANEATLGNLITTNFEATNAEIEDIKAKYITAKEVKADYMEVTNWTSAGKIRADRIDLNELFSKSGIIPTLTTGTMTAIVSQTGGLVVTQDMFFIDSDVSWKEHSVKTADGSTVTIRYLGSS